MPLIQGLYPKYIYVRKLQPQVTMGSHSCIENLLAEAYKDVIFFDLIPYKLRNYFPLEACKLWKHKAR